jgi:predicted secreted protein
MKFALKGYGDDTKYKGVHRAILISSIAKFHGYKFNSQTGLVDRINNKTVSKDPDEIAQYLLGDNAKGADLDSVDSIVNKIKSDPNYDAMTADAVKYFEKDGLKLPEAVQYEGREWFRNTLDKLNEV